TNSARVQGRRAPRATAPPGPACVKSTGVNADPPPPRGRRPGPPRGRDADRTRHYGHPRQQPGPPQAWSQDPRAGGRPGDRRMAPGYPGPDDPRTHGPRGNGPGRPPPGQPPPGQPPPGQYPPGPGRPQGPPRNDGIRYAP